MTISTGAISSTSISAQPKFKLEVLVGLAAEVGVAPAVSWEEVRAVGLVQGQDLALTATPDKSIRASLPQDVSNVFGLDWAEEFGVGLAQEINNALGLSSTKSLEVLLTTELDGVFGLSVQGGSLWKFVDELSSGWSFEGVVSSSWTYDEQPVRKI